MTDLVAVMRQAFAAYERDDLDETERLCGVALAGDSRYFDAHHLLGVLHTRREQPDKALASYERALAIRPDHPQLLSNRAVVLDDWRRFEEALVCLDKALALQPDHAAALSNRGNTLSALRRSDEALASYDKALAIVPDFADCHFNRAMLLLMLGRQAEGWREYEWRRALKSWTARAFTAPEWRGEELGGRTLLLYAEQGLGDTMQFGRFAPSLAARGINVVLWVQPSLRRLLQSLEGVAAVVDGSEALPQFDRHLPLLSVPFALGLGDGETPASIPYLAAEPERVERWAARLPSTGGLRVGIAWQGDPKRKIDRGRSPPLAAYAPLAAIPGVRLFSLQKNDGLEQLANLPEGMRVETLGDDFDAGPDGFLDSAAVMMHLDLVITSDSAVAHLAGALGRPVWIVLKDVPDWRWLLDRENSPWYPSARLFRQTRRDDWDEVFARVAARLAAASREGLPAAPVGAAAGHPKKPKRRDIAGLLKSAFAAYGSGEIGETERLCHAAIAADARCRDAHGLLGVALSQSGRHAEALASYERALALRPDDPEALSNRGNALHQLRRYDEALASFDRALELRPDFAEALSNRGSTLHELLRYEAALASYDRAVALRPEYTHALSNRGLVLADLQRHDEALASYDRALALAPDYADCRFNRALLLLALGRFAEGWREYEARFPAGHVVLPRLQQPRWGGEPLAGRTLLLIAEQGYGDTLQFCRYAALCAAQGGKIVLLAPRPLARLLGRLDGIAQIISDGDALPPFDLYCPLLSLPGILGTTPETIPANVPYLTADPTQVAVWRQRLDRLPGLRVGLVWAGNPRLDQPSAHAIDARRSIALAEFDRLAEAEGVSFVSLQKGPPAAQTSSPPPGLRLHDWTDELKDFADTAALVAALDLVITVDTAVAHLAGALGKPVWVLSRYDGCWRWLRGRDDSPWYPSLRLFHQQAPGDWSGAQEQVARRLAALAKEEIVRPPPPPPALDGEAARAAAAVAMQAALAAYQRGALGEALAEYDRAAALCPDDPQALSNRGVILHALGRFPEALASLDRALALLPDFPQALSNHGSTLHELGRYAEALASHDRALALTPGFAQAWSNRGNTLHELGRYEEAVASCERALELLPEFPQASSNRGHSLQALGRAAEALASFDRALALQPDFVDCRCKRAVLLLQLGHFADGWREYEARRRLPSWTQWPFAGPEWQGDDLSGRRLLLYAEQGLGDTIQFARFAPRLAAGGAKVVLQVQPPLRRLLAGLPGVTVGGLGDDPGAIDCHLPLLSVPGVLGLDATGFAPAPYLAAEPERVQHWASRLPSGGLRIGIAWQGKPGRLVDRGRSPPLAAFAPLAAIPGVRLISLQKNDGLDQLNGLPPGMRVATLGDDFDDGPDAFLDAAAVMMQFDLVITCDSAIAHLAGALGRPVWIVLQHVPDWRWQLGRADSPWYPTARLFRQTSRGDWDQVFRQIAAELTAWTIPADANIRLASDSERPSTFTGQQVAAQQKTPADRPSRARTLVFCTAFAADHGVWETRYLRWLQAIRGGGLEFDQVLIVDDGSPTLPEWADVQVMTEAMPLAPAKPTVLFHFRNHLGRHSVFDFPGWYRSFTFAATFARQNGFNRIIHIESDAYLISRRIVEYVNGLDDGWTAFWCKRWNFPEIAIQVIAGDALRSFIEIAQRPYSAFGGEPPEKMLPFTHVERSFAGDRYGEYAERVPHFADYAAQTLPDAAREYYWWLAKDAPALTDAERQEEEYLFTYLDGVHLAAHGGDVEQTLATLLRAAEIAPHRAEPLHAAATVCFVAGRYEEGYQIARRGIDLPQPATGLGIEPTIYQYGILEAFSINAHRAGHFEESLKASDRLLREGKMLEQKREQIEMNVRLTRGKIPPFNKALSQPAPLTEGGTVFDFNTPGALQREAIANEESECRTTGLVNLAIKHKTDKWGDHWYMQHYERHFAPLKDQQITLLEIGVGGYDNPNKGGESLRVWEEYFSSATIFGIDLFDKTALEKGRVRFRQGSQIDRDFLNRVVNETGGFDIIIDDGSHLNAHIIQTFLILFPVLSDGGLYAIEDLQTSYWPRFGGSSKDLNCTSSALGFFKTLIDALNHEEIIRPGYEVNYFDTHIKEMHFYHNLLIIKKGNNQEGSNHLKNNVPIDGVPGFER